MAFYLVEYRGNFAFTCSSRGPQNTGSSDVYFEKPPLTIGMRKSQQIQFLK